ncbi:MAG: hypothetical protein IKN74_05135 [Clostridia bacterium]|nr:hypothetical protein [Clostridia bacterium]
MVDHIYTDCIFLQEACEDSEGLRYAILMILLCSSYSYILSISDYVRQIIDYDKNSYDVNEFRNYNNYEVKWIDIELRIYDNRDNSLVWTIET